MAFNIHREDDINRGFKSIGDQYLNSKKLAQEGWGQDTSEDTEGEEAVPTESKGSATVGFSKNVRVVGQSNTDKEFNERLALHKTEIDAFLASHPEVRLER